MRLPTKSLKGKRGQHCPLETNVVSERIDSYRQHLLPSSNNLSLAGASGVVGFAQNLPNARSDAPSDLPSFNELVVTGNNFISGSAGLLSGIGNPQNLLAVLSSFQNNNNFATQIVNNSASREQGEQHHLSANIGVNNPSAMTMQSLQPLLAEQFEQNRLGLGLAGNRAEEGVFWRRDDPDKMDGLSDEESLSASADPSPNM